MPEKQPDPSKIIDTIANGPIKSVNVYRPKVVISVAKLIATTGKDNPSVSPDMVRNQLKALKRTRGGEHQAVMRDLIGMVDLYIRRTR
jgi:hypothetical protein